MRRPTVLPLSGSRVGCPGFHRITLSSEFKTRARREKLANSQLLSQPESTKKKELPGWGGLAPYIALCLAMC